MYLCVFRNVQFCQVNCSNICNIFWNHVTRYFCQPYRYVNWRAIYALWHFNPLIVFEVHFTTNFEFSSMHWFSHREILQSSEPESVFQERQVERAFPLIHGFNLFHGGYWLRSLRLRSELAQLAMRLQSWILDSREAELSSCVVAQRSLVRTASSASCNTGLMAASCGQTGGRGGATAGVEAGVEGEGTAGRGRAALPPAAAPSQCSGLGTDTLAWLLLALSLSSGAWDSAGDWAASCLSLTWDNAAWAFRAERSKEQRRQGASPNTI